MRYTSAVVLSTLAVGQAAAANHHNRHASFHARRETKRSAQPDADVDWKGIAYDLKDINWSTVKYTGGFGGPSAAATPTPDQKQSVAAVAPTVVAEAHKEKPTSAIVVATSTKSAEKHAQSSAAATPSSKVPSTGGLVGKLVANVMNGVAELAGTLDCQVGKNENSQTNGVGIWIGTDSKWGMDVTNTGSQYAIWYCWQSNGYSGMIVKSNKPDISVGLDPGEMVQLSFAEGVPAACAPAKAGTSLKTFGGIDETWAEVTFEQTGKFDVSKNPNMHGSTISMVGEQCTSDMNTCYFACKDSAQATEPSTTKKSCLDTYDLFGVAKGCGGGYDSKMGGTGGGCEIKDGGERLKVSFS